MKARHARQIRSGILIARNPKLRPRLHAAPRLTRQAAERERKACLERAKRKLMRHAMATINRQLEQARIDAKFIRIVRQMEES